MNRYFLCFIALLLSLNAAARKLVVVERGNLTTAPGIGGYAQTGYAFVKGDVITITAKASKQLDRMIVMIYPEEELGRDLGTKAPHYTFTMPHDGIVVFRFISDRGGTNKISYSVSRMPASDRVQRYNTRVIWQKPANGMHGQLIPRRAGR